MKHLIVALLIGSAFAVSSSVSARASVPYMTEPSLSPDRKEIAFVSGGDIWSVPADGGTARLLVSHPATESKPLFSPDGKWLAFLSNRTGNGDIYLLDLNKGNLRRLTFDDGLDSLDAWSRDGKWIYFSSNARDIAGMNDIYRVPADGGTPMQISSDRYTNEFGAAPLADGSVIFSARGISNSQWWRRGRSHIDETEIWSKTGDSYTEIMPRGAKQMWPMATADGSQVYFVSDRSGEQNIWAKPRNGQAKQLTNFTNGRVLFANISYDGREIVFERNFKIWKMNAESGKASEVAITLRGAAANPLRERQNLGTQIRDIALSPDGKKIAVIARGEVFAASAKDGGEVYRVTNTAAPESYVAWSADSRKVIYSSERDGSMSVFEYDFGTETETRLTRGTADDAAPVYSPDGKYIMFVRDARRLMLYDTNTKQERELTRFFTDPPPLLGNNGFKWSPDSKWIAYLTNAPENRSYTNVNVVSVDGGAARPVSFLANSFSGTISWSPDGKYLLFDSSQ